MEGLSWKKHWKESTESSYEWQAVHRPTCEGGILREDVFGCWSKHNEDIDDAAFRNPTHICLWRLTGALHIIQHFPKHSLGKERKVCE